MILHLGPEINHSRSLSVCFFGACMIDGPKVKDPIFHWKWSMIRQWIQKILSRECFWCRLKARPRAHQNIVTTQWNIFWNPLSNSPKGESTIRHKALDIDSSECFLIVVWARIYSQGFIMRIVGASIRIEARMTHWHDYNTKIFVDQAFSSVNRVRKSFSCD